MRHHLQIMRSEPLLQFAARYARSRGVNLRAFFWHNGIDLSQKKNFDKGVIKLAAITGNDATVLRRQAVRLSLKLEPTVLAQHVQRTSFRLLKLRYCPKCVVDDHTQGGVRPFNQVHCRGSWLDRSLHVCPAHSTSIVVLSKGYPSYPDQDFTGLMMKHWKEVKWAAGNSDAVTCSGFDRYFGARLDGYAATNDLLDDLRYDAAMRVCEAVGLVDLHGIQIVPSTLSIDERAAGARRGFEILEGGYHDLRIFLRKNDERILNGKEKGSGKNLYGPLYLYLLRNAQNPDFKPIVDFVYDHAVSTHSLGPKINILQRPAIRRMFSMTSAAREYGIHEQTLRKLVRAFWESNPTKRVAGKMLIEINDLEALIEKWRDGISMLDVEQRLNASSPSLIQLAKAGHFGGEENKLFKFFSASKVESFVAELEAAAVSNSRASDLVPLRSCTPFANYIQIIEAILAGELPLTIERPDGVPTNLSHLRVSLSDVRNWAGVFLPSEHLKTYELTAILKVSRETVHKLIELGALEARYYKERQFQELPAISKKSAEIFAEKHISFGQLKKQLKSDEMAEQRIADIQPIYDFGISQRIYLRSDL